MNLQKNEKLALEVCPYVLDHQREREKIVPVNLHERAHACVALHGPFLELFQLHLIALAHVLAKHACQLYRAVPLLAQPLEEALSALNVLERFSVCR